MAPALLCERTQLSGLAHEICWLACHRTPSIVTADDAFTALGAMRTEQNRRTIFLDWLGIAAQGRKAHEFTLVARFRLGPQHAQRLDRFAQPLPARREDGS